MEEVIEHLIKNMIIGAIGSAALGAIGSDKELISQLLSSVTKSKNHDLEDIITLDTIDLTIEAELINLAFGC